MASSSSSDYRGGDDDEKSSPFRCLPAARFAAACLMTALVLVVLVKAITVVHRDETLSLSLVQGAIFATRISKPAQQQQLQLTFSLRARNPSNRARMYYLDVHAYLFNTSAPASSSNPKHDCFMHFSMGSLLDPEPAHLLQIDTGVTGTRGTMRNSSFDMLYNSSSKTEGIMSDVTMRLDGILTVELGSGHNKSAGPTTYYCWPLVVGPDTGNVKDFLGLNLKDVYCREVQGRHFI